MSSIQGLIDYMIERYEIFLRRQGGLPAPWTTDPILQEYKFTNVFRSDDYTTRTLRSRLYLPNADRPLVEHLGNSAIYRYFGHSGFAQELGWQSSFCQSTISSVVHARADRGETSYTGAYLVTNAGRPGPKEEVVGSFCKNVWEAAEQIIAESLDSNRWETMVSGIRRLDGFGQFMAKEVALDTFVAGQWKPEDEFTWSPIGPGGIRGLNRVTGRPLNKAIQEHRALEEMRGVWTEVRYYWPGDWPPLRVTDIQFNLCEYDKYERVRLGQGRPRSKFKPRSV